MVLTEYHYRLMEEAAKRARKIIDLHDNMGWSFQRIAEWFEKEGQTMTRQNVFRVYKVHKGRENAGD